MFLNYKMIKFPRTLTFRLTLWYALAFTFFWASAFLIIYLSFNSILDNRVDEDLREDIYEFRQLFEAEGMMGVEREVANEVKPGDEEDIVIQLFNLDGKSILSTDTTAWQVLDNNTQRLRQLASNAGLELETLPRPEQEYDARVIYGLIAPGILLVIGESLEEKEDIMEIMLAVLLALFVIVIPLTSLVGWFMARQGVKGIEQISRTAREIELGDLGQRVSVATRGDEVQQLADTFNAMLDRINVLISEMRELTDNVAHDLRSPLARIRVISEQSLTKSRTADEHRIAAENTIEECDRLLQMINATLDLAELEAGAAQLTKSEIDIAQLASDACELFQPVAEEKDIDLSYNLAPAEPVWGNIQSLQRMLANLLDNAIKYTPPKGKVRVDLASSKKDITLSVIDTGFGIPETDQGHIFKRFFRGDQSRQNDGCGVGLSFALAVARAHGGDINFSSEPGKGSQFNITLPSSG